jgi:hypothetical protein
MAALAGLLVGSIIGALIGVGIDVALQALSVNVGQTSFAFAGGYIGAALGMALAIIWTGTRLARIT